MSNPTTIPIPASLQSFLDGEDYDVTISNLSDLLEWDTREVNKPFSLGGENFTVIYAHYVTETERDEYYYTFVFRDAGGKHWKIEMTDYHPGQKNSITVVPVQPVEVTVIEYQEIQ